MANTDEGANKHVHFAAQHRSCRVSGRRRLHTENEISSMLILEQLSSILNDETAHLEDTVDVDLLSDEELGATEANEMATGNSLTAAEDARSTLLLSTSPSGDVELGKAAVVPPITSEATSVKQPLSNVDRYSMLGGQIS